VLRRPHRFMESKQASFKRKDVDNLVGLLKKIGFREQLLPFTILGFLLLEKSHRRKLKDLFDENYLEKDNLKILIRNITSEIASLKSDAIPTNELIKRRGE
jgi:hypothetical protein